MKLIVFFLVLFPPVTFATPYNVLLISIDTLRADRLGCYGFSQPTPTIDSLAKDSILFETAISQVPLTLPSHATIFTGLFPDEHGIRNNENFRLQKRFTTLAEVFQENGYDTGAVIGSFSLDSSFGLDQGFDFYEDNMQAPSPQDRYVERRAQTVWKLGEKWLKERHNPWFLFLHFFDPHTAYNPPPPFPKTYQGEIAYTDSILGRVLHYLKAKNLYNTTIIILLSDHGESLGEHGETSHGVFLYDATLRVPLMVRIPGVKPARISKQVRLVDVAPTLLRLVGLKTDAMKPSGTDLFEGKDLPAYSESFYTNLLMGWAPLYSVRYRNKKFILAPRPEFYDLARDPGERNNLYTSSMILRDYQKELQKHLHSQPQAADNFDPEIREKLASLGYITGGSTQVISSTFDPKDGIHLWIKVEEAVTLAQSGKWESSIRLLEEVLKEQPENVLIKRFLANIFRTKGDPDSAIRYLQDALKSPLHQKETLADLAKAYYEKGNYQEALQHLRLLLKEKNLDKTVLKLAGFSAFHAKNYEEASRYLEQARKLDPQDLEILTNYGRVLSYLGRDQDALEIYTQISAQREWTEDETIQVAAIYLTRKDFDSAEKYFRQAIRKNSAAFKAWKGIALIQANRGELAQAVVSMLQAKDCSGAREILQRAPHLSNEIRKQFVNQCGKF